MRHIIAIAAILILAGCAKPIDSSALKPGARIGVVSLNSPYFYAANTGILRPANEFTKMDIESWRLGDAITSTISKKIAGCSGFTVVPVNYNEAALVKQYMTPISSHDQNVLENLLTVKPDQEYDLSKVTPSLVELMQAHQLDYLYVAEEVHPNGPYHIAFMRGTTGLHYDPNVARLTLYFRSAATILDRSGIAIASSPVNNSIQMVPESSYAFAWKKDPAQYTQQDLELFRRVTVDLMNRELSVQISNMGLCSRAS